MQPWIPPSIGGFVAAIAAPADRGRGSLTTGWSPDLLVELGALEVSQRGRIYENDATPAGLKLNVAVNRRSVIGKLQPSYLPSDIRCTNCTAIAYADGRGGACGRERSSPAAKTPGRFVARDCDAGAAPRGYFFSGAPV